VSPTSSCAAVARRYGSFAQFCDTFSVANQARFTQPALVERCFFGTAPTLGMVGATWDGMTGNTAAAWLSIQLADLGRFCGARDKLSDEQLSQTAQMISEDFFYLKVTELMLFFRWFKSGRYGKFYGTIDPMTITTALRQFVEHDRGNAIARHESELDERKKAEARHGCISYGEYIARGGKPNKALERLIEDEGWKDIR